MYHPDFLLWFKKIDCQKVLFNPNLLLILFFSGLTMVRPNLHGLDYDQINEAKVFLGKRRFEEFEAARRMILKGQVYVVPPDQNDPLRTANNRKWSPEARLEANIVNKNKTDIAFSRIGCQMNGFFF